MLPLAPNGMQSLPLAGPEQVAVRPFRNPQESFEATMAALEGVHLGSRPDLWQPYPEAREQVLGAAKPMRELVKRFPDNAAIFDRAVIDSEKSLDSLVYLPLVGRKALAWTVLLDASTAEVVGFIPFDSF
jgi:hypothetical protein